MIFLSVIAGIIIVTLVALLIYFGDLRSNWDKPNEYGAAITFKNFLTLHKINPEKWYLKDYSVAYIDKHGFFKDVYFVTFKEFYGYYKWHKKYSKEKAIEATLNNTQELRKEWDELLHQEKEDVFQQIDYYEKILEELKEKYNINF